MLVLKVFAKKGEASAMAVLNEHVFPCVIGKNGAVPAADKREGDGCTPLGRWILTEGFYRPDRKKPTGICKEKLNIGMGWCDDADDKMYNKLCDVTLKASHEKLWREDSAYDYLAVMNYNLSGKRAPDGKGYGSAIFLHVWRDGVEHTEGCVALQENDLFLALSLGVDVVEVSLT